MLLLRAMRVLQCLFTLRQRVLILCGLMGKLLLRAIASWRLLSVIAKTALDVVPTSWTSMCRFGPVLNAVGVAGMCLPTRKQGQAMLLVLFYGRGVPLLLRLLRLTLFTLFTLFTLLSGVGFLLVTSPVRMLLGACLALLI